MAKHKHNTASKDPKIIAHTKSFLGKWQAATTLHSRLPPIIPKRVARAHSKAHLPPPPTQPTLGDRFHALPPEIRAHIFSLILVQPIKWDLPHTSSCTLLPTHAPSDESERRCIRYRYVRNPERGYDHPHRSAWAPEKRNGFMCSGCWDYCFRSGGHPMPWLSVRAPCLCARRQGLEVLLVCKRWYEEAGFVFYSQNTFAFAGCMEFVTFVDALPEKWRSVVGRVNILLAGNGYGRARDWVVGQVTTPSHRMQNGYGRDNAWVWSRIRLLTSLSYLELDAAFLMNVVAVKAMLRLGLRGTRRVNFALSNPDNKPVVANDSKWIYPNLHHPVLLVGGFPEEVARAIKGERRLWMRRGKAVGAAVERFGGLIEEPCRCLDIDRQSLSAAASAEMQKYDCHDCEEWRRLWEKTEGASHPSFLRGGRYGDREGVYWRDWLPMTAH